VDVDANTRKRLLMMSNNVTSEDRALLKRVLRKHVEKDPKSKRERVRYTIQMKADGYCPMLDEDSLCNIHKRYGEQYLPVVCTTYPRRLQRVEGRYELSATLSCPEVVRQLLLHDDAIDVVPWERQSEPRLLPSYTVDPDDAQPFLRQQQSAREMMWSLIRLEGYSLEQRLFFMTWFAKRTSPIMRRDVIDPDPSLIERERATLAKPAVLEAIQQRFKSLETPNKIVLLVIQELVRPDTKGGVRSNFRSLVDSIINGYAELRDLVMPEVEGDELKLSQAVTEAFWEEYCARRDQTMAAAGARVEQFFTNYAFNFWFHRLPIEAPDLMVHMLRMLTQVAVFKFLIFSHPDLLDALAARDTAAAEGDAVGMVRGEAALIETVDKVGVEVFYKTARFMDHGPILRNLEKALAANELESLAGAVYLIRF